MKNKGLLLVEQPDDFLIKSWSCTALGSWIEPMARFIEKVVFVNKFRIAVSK
jgi:hypothetical protein